MTLAFARNESHPMVDVFLRARVPRWEELNRAIDERDDMLDFTVKLLGYDRDRALANYFINGLEQYRLLRHIARWRFPDGPPRMLDFASGYGRLTRLLVHERFAGALHVSDILEDAMRFQSAEFGVEWILSTTEPEDLPISGPYDLIFVASLFTHLPPGSFTRWLRRLAALLAPGGLLVLSVHDESISPTAVEGISFRAESESRVLDQQEYGSTWVTEAFMRQQVATLGGNFDCVRLPRALLDWQDVYVISPAVIENATPRIVPKGFIDTVIAEESGVRISGWASCVSEDAERVDIRLDDAVVATTSYFVPRVDVVEWLGVPSAIRSGWGCVIPHERVRSFRYQVVTVAAYSSSGEERIIIMGSLDGLQGHVQGERARDLERRLHEAQTEIASLREQLAVSAPSRFGRLRQLVIGPRGRNQR